MERVRRRRLGRVETFELWSRWRSGEPLKDIASALVVCDGTVRQVVSSHGGVAPQLSRRSGSTLTLQERTQTHQTQTRQTHKHNYTNTSVFIILIPHIVKLFLYLYSNKPTYIYMVTNPTIFFFLKDQIGFLLINKP